MEKRDLEVLVNGCIIGAFENVRDVVETEDSISFKSDDGEYKYEKGVNGIYKCVEADEAAKATCLDRIRFTDYKIQVRRTTKAHFKKDGYELNSTNR